MNISLMKKILILAFVVWGNIDLVAQIQPKSPIIYQGEEKARVIEKGRGQEFSREFIDIGYFHFVQFGVYPVNTSRDKLKAPEVGQVWLIHHKDTQIKGVAGVGALYIVKPFANEEDAKNAVATYRSQKIRCWYNAELTGAAFELVGTTAGGVNIDE